MKRIRRQFGAKFADALAKCPTLVADLAELRAAGVKIRKLSGRCQAYSNSAKMTISISARCSLSYKLISLAHEKVHVLVSLTPNPTPGVTGRQTFIDMCLNAETDAIEHEVQVATELLAAHIEVDNHSKEWLARWRRGRRAAIRKAIEEAYTSTTGETYPDYYGGWYDEVIKPKDRLPLRCGDRLHRSKKHHGCGHIPLFDFIVYKRLLDRLGDYMCPRFSGCTACEAPITLNLPVDKDA